MIGTGLGLGLSGYRLQTGQWSPSNVATLQLWLDASDASTLLQSSGGSLASADGDPVGYWADKSGNGRHATQTDGTKKPALKIGVQNGKNAIRLDGSNDLMALASGLQAQPRTVVIVYKKIGSKFIGLGHGSNGETGEIVDWTDGNIYSVGQSSLSSSASGNNSSYTIFCATFASNGVVTHRKNGQSRTVSSSSATSGASTINQLGARSTDVGNGDICELVYYDSVLSITDILNIEFYLNAKWSIY